MNYEGRRAGTGSVQPFMKEAVYRIDANTGAITKVADQPFKPNARTFASMEFNGKTGFADGIRCDEDGNVWSSAGWVGDGYDGVHIFHPDGTRIGQIRLPEICSNVCFGGTKRNRLFMTASQSLYAVFVETKGAHIT